MVTVADVALRAGVGVGTVSRVLNDSAQVTGETRERVRRAMEELGYQPRRRSRDAVPRPAGQVGVLLHFFEGPSSFQRLRTIITTLQPHGLEVVLYVEDSPDRARRRLAELPTNNQLDGLIIMSLPLREDEGERLANGRFPTVLLDTFHPALPSVTIDDYAGGIMATQYLLDLGHRRVAFVGEPHQNPFGFIASRLREEGYREALRRAGLDVLPGYIRQGPHLRSAGRQMTMELLALAEPPTGIVSASDLQAVGVLEGASALNLQVPQQLSVIGFDDIELASYVRLSTIRQSLELSGQRAAELLLGVMGATGRPAPLREVLQLELVVRNTTGIPPR